MSEPPWSEFAEPDYAFGTGTLRIAVDRVVGWRDRNGDRFAVVHGVEYCWNGQVINPDREVWIRATALFAAGFVVP